MMEDYLKKYGLHSILVSALLIILSLLLVFKPVATINILIIFFGAIVVINGLIHAVSYFQSPKEFKPFSFELVYGILGILAGFAFILKPEWVTSFLPVVIGIWILIESIIRFQLSINMREIPNSNWGIMLALSILTAICGIYIIIHPAITAALITTLCGIFLLVSELINIYEAIYIMIKLR